MIRRYRGIITYLKRFKPWNIYLSLRYKSQTISCKKMSYCLKNLLNLVVKAVNKLKGMLYQFVCLKSYAMAIVRFLTIR